MKIIFILIIFSCFTLQALCQQPSPDSARPDDSVGRGFTNKAEAKNELINGVKEGKWVEYIYSGIGDTTNIKNADGYRLAIYKKGSATGLVRLYLMNGELHTIYPYVNGMINGLVKSYYADGKAATIDPYTNGKINGISKGFYKSGKLWYTCPFTNDIENGTLKT